MTAAHLRVVDQPPDGQACFSAQELSSVLMHYALGRMDSVRALYAGSPAAPKALIECARGRLVLKRRAPGDDKPERVVLGQAVQLRLERAKLPVPRLIGTRHNKSMVQHGGAVYELSVFSDAGPFQRREPQAEHAGVVLAQIHGTLRGFRPPGGPIAQPPAVAERIGHGLEQWRANGALRIHAKMVSALASDLHERFAGYDEPDNTPELIHGDYHPRNLLFYADTVAAVFDFDGVHRAPWWVDLVQAAAQFSIQTDTPAADLTMAGAICRGYRSVSGVLPIEADQIGTRMAQSMLCELVTSPRVELIGPVIERVRWLIEHGGGIAQS